MLPNFLIIGAMKSGTTSLWAYLRDHPEVFLAPEKEVHFFDREANWRRGVDWYEGLFEGSEGFRAVGEASPGYTRAPEAPERIARVVPDAKLIYVLRHPIERMRSHYKHDRLRRKERRKINDAVFRSEKYIEASRYATWIERYLKLFDRDQLSIVISEDLRTDRVEAVRRVFRFLEIDADVEVVAREYNTTKDNVRHGVPYHLARRAPGPIRKAIPERFTEIGNLHGDDIDDVLSPEVNARLERMLADEVRRLREYLGDGFHGWGIA